MKTTIHCGEIFKESNSSMCCGERIKKLEKILSAYLEKTKILPEAAAECEISLTFADVNQIAGINEEYREVAGPTDVLSFPMWENEDGGFEPPEDWERLTLGDIIVCPEIVAKNASDNGKTAECETVLVICHGFLHLIGFDHADDAERERMWQIQDSLVSEFFAEG